MAYSDKGTPRAHIAVGVIGPRRLITSAYRAAFILSAKRIKKGQLVWRHVCLNSRCCNPAHCKASTQKEMGAEIAARGVFKGNPIRALVNARNIRNRTSVEVVRRGEAMFAEGATTKDVAAAIGVHKGTARLIRRGVHANSSARLKVVNGASVFGWRGFDAVNDDEARAA